MNSVLKEKYSVFFDSIECGKYMVLAPCDSLPLRNMK